MYMSREHHGFFAFKNKYLNKSPKLVQPILPKKFDCVTLSGANETPSSSVRTFGMLTLFSKIKKFKNIRGLQFLQIP